MSTQTSEIVCRADGTLAFIWDDDLAPLMDAGNATIRRASHVEPSDGGQWEADLSPVGGPKIGPFLLRRDALAAEVNWLRSHGY